MPRTSMSARAERSATLGPSRVRGPPLRRLGAHRKVFADEQVEAAARAVRKDGRARDDGALEQRGARARARAGDGGDHAAQDVLGGGDVLQEILDDALD